MLSGRSRGTGHAGAAATCLTGRLGTRPLVSLLALVDGGQGPLQDSIATCIA